MEFVKILSLVCIFEITCWHLTQAVSLEPEFTKYQFIEQVIERMVRMSDKMDDFVKKMDNFQNTMDQWKDKMEAINGTVTQTLYDMEANNREFKSNLTAVNKQFLEEMTAWRDATENEFKQNVQSKLDTGTAAVAFNVYRMAGQTLTQGDPVVFDNIRLNTCGDCYSTATGVFTAPVGGIYQFNAQLCTNKDKELEYHIVVGSMVVIKGEYRASTDSTDEKCTAFSVVSKVEKGQTVSVRGYNTPLDANSDDELNFSGVLVHHM